MEFVPIRVNTLRPDAVVLFDVFIQIGARHIHYIRKSEPFESGRIDKLKGKGVRKLWVKEAEEPAYLAYLDAGLDTLQSAGHTVGQKARLAHDTLVTDAENAGRGLETEEGYKRTESRVSKVIDFLRSDQGVLKSILESTGCALDDYQHSANVASMCAALALRIGGVNPREMLDLSLGALVHDIGKSKYPADFDARPEAERGKIHARHSQMGVDLLAEKKYVTPGLLRLVHEHEEFGDGQGFPERKNHRSLPLTSQILSLCNHFDRLSMNTKTPPTQLMTAFFQEKSEFFELDHIVKLGEMLNGK